MFNDNRSCGGGLLDMAILGGLFWMFGQSVRHDTLQEVKEAAESIELATLRKELEDLKQKLA